MLRPRWILALVLAMAVAAGFAWLGKWQLGRAVQSDQPISVPTEQVRPFIDEADPGRPILEKRIGQMVTVTGSFVPGDYQIVDQRVNHGVTGFWVVGHLTLTQTDADGRAEAVAVARGWAPTRADAGAAVRHLAGEPASEVTFTGRMLPSEAPAVPASGQPPMSMTTVAIADLFNRWHDVDDTVAYTAYIVEHGHVAGLTPIFSPPPIEQATLNWLNVFYAVEWAVFAGFALYLWYRVVKDVWERENDTDENVVTIARKVD